jgi:cytochrome c oxidase subunit 4
LDIPVPIILLVNVNRKGMSNEKHHIVSYKSYFLILLGLLALTGISVAVTQVELGVLTVAMALFLASLKSFLVLSYFMHLKFDKSLYTVMVAGVLLVFVIVIVITFLDYSFR